MDPDHERFAELATRRLEASPDLREEARAEVLGRLAHGGGGDVTIATGRLASGKPRSPWVMACFVSVAVIAMGLWAGWQVKHAISELRALHQLIRFGPPARFEEEWRKTVDPATCDFVFAVIGDDREVIKKLQRQWELHPDEPGIYEELTYRRFAANEPLPADFSETWRRFDSDNGLWPYLEAVGKNEEWKRTKASSPDPYSREALDLLLQSAAAPRFESYLPELRKRRLAMLGATESLARETEVLLYSISALWEPSVRHQRDAVLTFGKAAKQMAAEKNAGELTALIKSWERLVGRLAGEGTTLLALVVPASSWNDDCKAMLKASRDLGLLEEEARLVVLEKQFADYQASYRRPSPSPKPMSSTARAMAIGSWSETVIDESDFEPGRRVEYAVVERMLGLAAALVVLLFFAGAGIESFRRGRRVNGLADGLGPLFRPADFLWTAFLGIVLPALWYFGITRWTPVGLRDIGMSHYKPQPVFIQAGAAMVLALLTVVQAARWRLTKRAGFLALKPARPWIGWTMAGIAALVIPLAGGVRWLTTNEVRYLQGIAATGGLPLLWLLWEASAVVFSSGSQSLGGVLLCRRMTLPLAMLAALLLGLWVPLAAAERHWHARDQVTRADRNSAGLTLLESRVTERVRERFRKAFPEAERAR